LCALAGQESVWQYWRTV